MLAVTTYLSTDVAAVPLMWVVPLALYLLTFIVAFGSSARASGAVAARLLPVVVLPLIVTLILGVRSPLSFFIPLHLTVFAVLALLCHVELSRRRPATQHLTEYYLWLATGGMLGGVFNTLLAPRVFTGVAEYPLAIACGCALLATSEQVRQVIARPQLLLTPAMAGVIATAVVIAGGLGKLATMPATALLGASMVMCFSVRRDQARFAVGVAALFVALGAGALAVPVQGGVVLHGERTFFGVYRVFTTPDLGFVSLAHGTTLHGRQVVNESNPEPLSYYHRKSPVGDVFAARGERAKSVGIIGLGVGTLAAYAQPDSRWTFYEIDPAVEQIARDSRFFRYLDACGRRCTVALGDARLTLARTAPQHDVLVLDAFSSDAVPVHLLTTEAMEVYEKSLAATGILAFHISNQHIQLRPAVARLARDRGWTAFGRLDRIADVKRGYQPSEWVVMTRHPEDLDILSVNPGWTRIIPGDEPAWSDDFSNVWTALRWRER
jgi:spermidine synthase